MKLAGAKADTGPKLQKPTDQEIARRVSGLFKAHRERKAAQATEDEHKAWFKERKLFGPLWRCGIMVVELVTKPRSSLDKTKVAKLLDGLTGKKFLSCFSKTQVTECQVYEEGGSKTEEAG